MIDTEFLMEQSGSFLEDVPRFRFEVNFSVGIDAVKPLFKTSGLLYLL